MDVDVIEHGMRPERPRPRGRLILSRLALAAVLVAGVAFAVNQHNHATAGLTADPPSHLNAGSPSHPSTAPAPAGTGSDEVVNQTVDHRPYQALPPGLLPTARQRLAAPPEAPYGEAELRGSDFQGGANGIGFFDESVSAPSTVRVDVVCLGVGPVTVAVEDSHPDDSLAAGGRPTDLDCGQGKIYTTSVKTTGKGIHVYAQLGPDTLAALAYVFRLP